MNNSTNDNRGITTSHRLIKYQPPLLNNELSNGKIIKNKNHQQDVTWRVQ